MAVPDTRATTLLGGRCHCGNLQYAMVWRSAVSLTLRACGCGYCSRHGAAWISHPDAPVELIIRDSDLVLAYRFGTASADFLSCRRCGILTLARADIAGHAYAVLNANTLESVDPRECARVATDFDGEDRDQRRARRQHNWSPLNVVLQ